jgi:predicted Abi (CAAX) family protease
MKLGKSITAWFIAAALGYAAGWYLLDGIDPQDASSTLKALAALFTAAFFSLGIIFRLVETAPPKELDDGRQDRWTRLFSNRWKLLWIRWFMLIGAALVSSLAFFALDYKLSFITERNAIASGSAAIVLGILAIIVSVYEILSIRKAIQEVNTTLKDAKRRQGTLNRLEGPPPESDKPARA